MLLCRTGVGDVGFPVSGVNGRGGAVGVGWTSEHYT
jgi:hypothetical protein